MNIILTTSIPGLMKRSSGRLNIENSFIISHSLHTSEDAILKAINDYSDGTEYKIYTDEFFTNIKTYPLSCYVDNNGETPFKTQKIIYSFKDALVMMRKEKMRSLKTGNIYRIHENRHKSDGTVELIDHNGGATVSNYILYDDINSDEWVPNNYTLFPVSTSYDKNTGSATIFYGLCNEHVKGPLAPLYAHTKCVVKSPHIYINTSDTDKHKYMTMLINDICKVSCIKDASSYVSTFNINNEIDIYYDLDDDKTLDLNTLVITDENDRFVEGIYAIKQYIHDRRGLKQQSKYKIYDFPVQNKLIIPFY